MTQVRPRFIVALVLAMPFLAHSIWDYVEARRLRARIEAIKGRGEPLGAARVVQLSAAAADADRLYRAAAALAAGFDLGTTTQRRQRLSKAIRDGDWTSDIRDEVRAHLARYSDALALADRAAELPFEGFTADTTDNYMVSHVWSLARICALTATTRALDGDSEGAYGALHSALRVERALSLPYHLPGLKIVLERSRPSPEARTRVMRDLEDINVDDLPKQSLIRMRSDWLGGYEVDTARIAWLARPWATHRLTRALDTFALLVDAAGKPEPQRLAALEQVGVFPDSFNISSEERRRAFERFTKSLVATTDWVRCARRAASGVPINCRL